MDKEKVGKKIERILVYFVEPMRYGLELIEEVYNTTEYEYVYAYGRENSLGDKFKLPPNAIICKTIKDTKNVIRKFCPEFVIINGYVGKQQINLIYYCIIHHIPYGIESDTPLHIPENRFMAIGKRFFLKTLLSHRLCFGLPGGTPQKRNLEYYGISQNNCVVMPMTVSTNRFVDDSQKIPSKSDLKKTMGLSGKRVFLFVGRLEEEKNVSLLIFSFLKALESRNDIALLIVGDGSERTKLEEIADKNNCIFFVGKKRYPDILMYYKMSDAFILPSTYEPWGLVINEAMSMGLPVVVSSAVGCAEDLVENRDNGYIFTTNCFDELVNAICMMASEDLTPKSDNALKTVDEWSFDYYRDQLLKLLAKVEGKYQKA